MKLVEAISQLSALAAEWRPREVAVLEELMKTPEGCKAVFWQLRQHVGRRIQESWLP